MLLLNKRAVPTAPATDKALIFLDTADKLIKHLDDGNALRAVGQTALAAIVAASAGIAATETIIVGGLNNIRIAANQLKVGTVIRATLQGTCTSTVANASTWRARLGIAGTTADAAIGTAANSVAAITGTAVPFTAELVLTVRTIGAAATLSGFLRLINTGVTGISAVESQVVQLTVIAFNSTVDNWLSFTYQSVAGTTSTFQNAFVEVVKI